MHFFRRHQRELLILALFLAVGFVTYGASLKNGFVDYDDTRLVLQNPLIWEISFRNLLAIFTSYEEVLYTPLLFLSFQIDYVISGLHPSFYHLHSLLLHIGSSLLVFAVLHQFVKSRSISLLFALLFLVHPLNTEAIAWVSARKDLLAGLFCLLTIFLFLRYEEGRSRKIYYLSILTFAAGLASKPSILALPFLLIILDYYRNSREQRTHWTGYAPFFALSLAFGFIGLFGNTQLTLLQSSSIAEKFLMAGKSSMFLLYKLFLPLHLSVIYPYTDAIAFFSPDFFLPLLFLILLLSAAWHIRRSSPEVLFGLTWFLIMLAPTFASFQIGENFGDVYFAADRYAYVPMIGILLGLGMLLEKRVPQRSTKPLLGSLSVIIIVFAFIAANQAAVWRTSRTLFQNVIRHYPDAQAAHNNIGVYFYERGLLPSAIESYKKSIALRPTASAYGNLGQAYMDSGGLNKAIDAFENTLEINPLHAGAQLNIGVAYTKLGMHEKALEAYRLASLLDAVSPVPFINMGLTYEQLDERASAKESYEKALKRDPSLTQLSEKIEELTRSAE